MSKQMRTPSAETVLKRQLNALKKEATQISTKIEKIKAGMTEIDTLEERFDAVNIELADTKQRLIEELGLT